MSEHPDSKQLVAYAEGRLAEPSQLERHLDTCEMCAEAVLISRQVACLDDNQLVKPLSPIESSREKQRLRDLFQKQPLGETRKITPAPALVAWGVLGALGAAASVPSPTPMLAGPSPAPPTTMPPHDSAEPGEIPTNQPPSPQQRAVLDELAQFLTESQESIDAHSLADEPDEGMPSSDHWDQAEATPADSGLNLDGAEPWPGLAADFSDEHTAADGSVNDHPLDDDAIDDHDETV